jgi:hypothetical protein
VTDVLIDGNQVLADGKLLRMAENEVLSEVSSEAPKLMERAGIF